jgi:hypothetical protein
VNGDFGGLAGAAAGLIAGAATFCVVAIKIFSTLHNFMD